MLQGHHEGVHEDEKSDCSLEVFVVHQSEEVPSCTRRLNYLLLELLSLPNSLNFDPASLMLSDEHVSELFLLLDVVEVVDDHSHEEVDDELGADYHEGNKVDD